MFLECVTLSASMCDNTHWPLPNSLSETIVCVLGWSVLISRWECLIKIEISPLISRRGRDKNIHISFCFLRNLLSSLFFKHSLFFLLKILFLCNLPINYITIEWKHFYQFFVPLNSCGTKFDRRNLNCWPVSFVGIIWI